MEDDLATDWRHQRRLGMRAILISGLASAALWFAVRHFAPIPPGMEVLAARMVFALKCCALAALFCLAAGIEAVAHERLQTPAFDPLAGHVTRRLQVNLRYVQNTLEQFVLFAVGLFGVAAYASSGEDMRVVTAATVTWIAGRLAFWAGYHRSAALRALGAPSMFVGLAMLVYLAARIGDDVAGTPGAVVLVGVFALFEAALFWLTCDRKRA